MQRTLIAEAGHRLGQTITLMGWLHWKRDLGGIRFLLLRDRSGLIQVVAGPEAPLPLAESVLRVTGRPVEQPKAPGGLELLAEQIEVLVPAEEPTPIEIPKSWRAHPETLFEHRYVSLRAPEARAPLKVQAHLLSGFRKFLDTQGFTEISTPKIVSAGAEGGSNLFGIDYFEHRAYLAQSPQLYKQILVGVFERVYEVAPVWRAEEHATSRHLNEYLSLDVEMAFIESEEELMDLEEALLQAMLEEVLTHASPELRLLQAEVPPPPSSIPRIPHAEALRLVRQLGVPVDLDLTDEAERALGEYFKAQGSDFVFITRYPQSLRPFYTYPEPDGTTRGFDLLFRGLEVTSGGQRIHRYQELLESHRRKGNHPEAFAAYNEVFKYGMPPHGGFALGAERFTQKLLGLSNVRQARAFPRDRHRLTP
jgi:nondiscriminating aspartyl-tRNA synthetase